MKRRKVRLTSDGRTRHRRVPSLAQYLKRYGKGSEGNAQREGFARRVGTTLAYLTHVALGNRRVSMELAVRIERETHGLVRAEDLHPSKEWDYIATRRRAAAQTASA